MQTGTMNIKKIETIEGIYNINHSNNAELYYFDFEDVEISLVKVLAPKVNSNYGVSIYPKLLMELSLWAVYVPENILSDVCKYYDHPSMKNETPSSLHPNIGWSDLEVFIPSKYKDSIIKHFQQQEIEFGNDSYIEHQWSLSDGLGKNYEDYLLFKSDDKNLSELKELYLNLKSNENHPVRTNRKIRKQINISLCLSSIGFGNNFESKIIDDNAIMVGIVNLLRWPNLYSNTFQIKSEFAETDYENKEIEVDGKVLNYRKELDEYLNYIETTYPSVLFKLDIEEL